jgi:hypothetical protein
LLCLAKQASSDGERIELSPHEASESIFGCAHDWFTAHVETGVDQNRQPVICLKRLINAW